LLYFVTKVVGVFVPFSCAASIWNIERSYFFRLYVVAASISGRLMACFA
jgi:hypothetical protein